MATKHGVALVICGSFWELNLELELLIFSTIDTEIAIASTYEDLMKLSKTSCEEALSCWRFCQIIFPLHSHNSMGVDGYTTNLVTPAKMVIDEYDKQQVSHSFCFCHAYSFESSSSYIYIYI
ncbi:hypothetical protein MANES_09G178000v8 [Manihot esculenta]|uniref:Uncharacterized protein n=1 Tax=Manihot esculenta TaxID=3983 RepID=A0A2C9VBT7_MANES|nr:hypothetical protein MANES_09G178000v8 [Manihot esculenta]